jgi:hypothetical protein
MAEIYESPDGGRTVYKREIGSSNRKLIKEDRSLHDQILESQLWEKIRRAAKSNPSLQEALDRVKIIYHLSKDNDNKIL